MECERGAVVGGAVVDFIQVDGVDVVDVLWPLLLQRVGVGATPPLTPPPRG